MTIGPEPMIRIDWMSVRFGIRPPLPHRRAPAVEQVGELLEQVPAVVRSRPGLRVVLHAERPLARDLHPLADAVVEVHVGHLGDAGEPVGVDREVVVLAGDLDPSGHEVLHRVVAAVVPERQLDRAAADRQTEQLVPEADPEDRHLAEQAADRVDGVRHGRRVAGSVRQEHPVGLAGEDVGRRRRGRNDLDPGEAGEVAQDRALDAVVVGDDERPAPDVRHRRRPGCRPCTPPAW